MRTKRLRPSQVALAAAVLRRGGLVAFPTETVYGLGADGLNPDATGRIYAAKCRPADNPLILHVTDLVMAKGLAAVWPDVAQTLAAAFWPGPLTLVVRRAAAVPDEVAAGLDTVGLRAPSHPLAQALIAACGRPIAAPSANRSGRPSPTTADDVLEDLDGRIEAVLDGGPADVGVESTVLDVTQTRPHILRQGGLAQEELEAVVGPLAAAPAGGPARSPGMKYRHYAPRTPLILAGAHEVATVLAAHPGAAALLTDETAAELAEPPRSLQLLGPRGDPATQARRLFAALRALDRAGAPVIVAEAVPQRDLGRTVVERLRRAAGTTPLQ